VREISKFGMSNAITSMTEQNPDTVPTSEVLACVKELLAVVDLIGDAISNIANKRITLEEKMIRNALHDLAAETSTSVAAIHKVLKPTGSKSHEPVTVTVSLPTSPDSGLPRAALDELFALTSEMHACFKELVKIINYDLNFLEQYYEHGFYGRLINENRFQTRLQEVMKQLLAGCEQRA
jgi:hypothetical protein